MANYCCCEPIQITATFNKYTEMVSAIKSGLITGHWTELNDNEIDEFIEIISNMIAEICYNYRYPAKYDIRQDFSSFIQFIPCSMEVKLNEVLCKMLL